MTDNQYGDYSRVARMAELRFLGASSELLVLPRPVDLTICRPGMACFYHIRRGHLRFYPDARQELHFDLGPGNSVGIEDGSNHRWLSFRPVREFGDPNDEVELFAGQVDRRHTVIQRLLNAVVILPPEATPQADIVRHCIEALIIAERQEQPNHKVTRRFSEVIQLAMLEYADQRLAATGPIPAAVRRDAPLLRAWTAFLNAPEHNWTVAELANVAGISRTALFERCRKAIGKAPLAAMREIRMDYAAEMLRHSQAPVSEIAAKVGYGSDVALLRAFRNHMGLTPAAWRATAGPLAQYDEFKGEA